MSFILSRERDDAGPAGLVQAFEAYRRYLEWSSAAGRSATWVIEAADVQFKVLPPRGD